jgi:translation initiation factor eIF-2B subunit delta
MFNLIMAISFLLSSKAGLRLFYNNPIINYGFYHVLLAEGGKTPAAASGAAASAKSAKSVKPPSQKNDSATVAVSEKKGGDRPPEKDRKKEVPQPRMQYDDKSRVEKAKRRAVVKQTEARNRVELFRHLPQYERGTQLPELESKFFELDPMHPAVYKVFI